jgi:hypothetical protein
MPSGSRRRASLLASGISDTLFMLDDTSIFPKFLLTMNTFGVALITIGN